MHNILGLRVFAPAGGPGGLIPVFTKLNILAFYGCL
jgi:hypothetical protein